MPKPLCRHCGLKVGGRPRGLCRNCYYADGVRDLYPATSKYASRRSRGETAIDAADFSGPSPLPVPTDALPGSEEKFLVLCERAAAGQSLRHPLDATNERRPAPRFEADEEEDYEACA